jgi:hypothetical protein
MFTIGERVVAGFSKGTVIAWDDENRARFPNVGSREREFYLIKFDLDRAGPNKDGWGIYHQATMMLRRLRPQDDK